MNKICYCTVIVGETGVKRVRFGLSRRAKSQVVVTCERWRRLSKLLAADGYRVVELEQRGGATKNRGS